MSSSNKEVSLVLDTDVGSDVDDAIALAFAMRHPRIDLQAVTTVSGDAALRARLARKLLELGGQSTVPVGAGVASPTGPGSRAWFGHEGVGVIDEDEDASPPADGVALLGRSRRRRVGPGDHRPAFERGGGARSRSVVVRECDVHGDDGRVPRAGSW